MKRHLHFFHRLVVRSRIRFCTSKQLKATMKRKHSGSPGKGKGQDCKKRKVAETEAHTALVMLSKSSSTLTPSNKKSRWGPRLDTPCSANRPTCRTPSESARTPSESAGLHRNNYYRNHADDRANGENNSHMSNSMLSSANLMW